MRTHSFTGLALAALLFAGTSFGADPRLMNLVMPDATRLAGANVTSIGNSPFGQYVLLNMTSAMNSDVQKLIDATGFDPRHDVSEIVAASSASQPKSALLLALGNFHVDELTAAAAKQPKVTVASYGGVPFFSDRSGESSLAFIGANIAVAGTTAAVKAAVDRSPKANSLDPALATRIQAISETHDAWAVSLDSMTSLIPGLSGSSNGNSPAAQVQQLLSTIQSSSGGLKFGSNVDVTIQAVMADPSSAKALADVITALASIFSMGAGQNPQSAALAQLLQALKVNSDGIAVNLALSVPEAQIEALVKDTKAPIKQ